MEENADRAKIGLMKSEACGQAGISRKTLGRWLDHYAQKGFDGLKYQRASAEPKRLIPGELVKEAILLRLEVPSRSVPQIIEILSVLGKSERESSKQKAYQAKEKREEKERRKV